MFITFFSARARCAAVAVGVVAALVLAPEALAAPPATAAARAFAQPFKVSFVAKRTSARARTLRVSRITVLRLRPGTLAFYHCIRCHGRHRVSTGWRRATGSRLSLPAPGLVVDARSILSVTINDGSKGRFRMYDLRPIVGKLRFVRQGCYDNGRQRAVGEILPCSYYFFSGGYAPGVWSTMNVCTPPDQPHAVGVRVRVPYTGMPSLRLFARFSLQYSYALARRRARSNPAGPGSSTPALRP
jgi:hypothetical protein